MQAGWDAALGIDMAGTDQPPFSASLLAPPMEEGLGLNSLLSWKLEPSRSLTCACAARTPHSMVSESLKSIFKITFDNAYRP